jgi:DNA uptake protein ComE-like DNA-binding protein
VDVNSAPAERLVQILGLDIIRARKIVEFRSLHGRYRGPADLAQVSGLTGDMIRRWESDGLLVFGATDPRGSSTRDLPQQGMD